MQPSEIERLAFWEYELVLQEINETTEREKEEQEQQEKGNTYTRYTKNMERFAHHPEKAVSNSGFHMPAMPTIPSINIPKI